MAETLPRIRTLIFGSLDIYISQKPYPNFPHFPLPSPFRAVFQHFATMASIDDSTNGTAFDVHEISPKIPKLSENGGLHRKIHLPLLRVKKLSDKAVLPSRASPLSAGYDLSSAAAMVVPARGKALIPTHLSIAIPADTYARIAPRSGLTWKNSIDVGAGVIDADYRGPIGVILFNHSDLDFEVKAGDRIAQMILERIVTPDVIEVVDLDATARGEGGFGSTGI
ncbi:deoxyuridine 5'-triphosphate nucleotidohydrolase-like [Zingiber officinale]|uniref:Deoxyuridine 5'-triphosphate nucleotidohydrolase n=1 Tax=Zingiber officinale TaxID=94328 RepID=A0A8J5LUF8_ZINOF|nr:deoxyuridine 5'-triphosphate nucleotidohydrolase-like [Zingiber officinale]KAG6530907.1 hypothetical protein ZIOFF_004672 [Zingiber officinale]